MTGKTNQMTDTEEQSVNARNEEEALTFRGQVLVELLTHDWNTAQLNELGVCLLEYIADGLSSLEPVRDALKEWAAEIDLEPLLMKIEKALKSAKEEGGE